MVAGLAVESLDFGYKNVPVLHEVSLQAVPGQVTALVGPNAAGKSTLLKCIAGILRGRGQVYVHERALAECSREEVVKLVAYLPQGVIPSAVLTVFEGILLARQTGSTWRVGDADLTAVLEIMRRLELEPLALRFLNELSSGQRQLVGVAQSLVREPRVLLMDEPTSNLDLQHQMEVLEFVRSATRERDLVTIIAIHDLNLAARYADSFLVLSQGAVYGVGPAREALTPEMLRDVYRIEAEIWQGPDGAPFVAPLRALPNRKRLNESTLSEQLGSGQESVAPVAVDLRQGPGEGLTNAGGGVRLS